MASSSDDEFDAMQTIYKVLEPLDDHARARVIQYIAARLEIAADLAKSPQTDHREDEAIEQEKSIAPKFESLAELVDATGPGTNSAKALVAGYWLQVCLGSESFDGFSANTELKNLGIGVANITMALDALRTQKPALALQIKKSGKSQQARKTYKLTVAGIKAVENMMGSLTT